MKVGVVKRPGEIKDWVDEEDFYSEEARILLVEDDELESWESGFMQGYEEAE